MSRAQRYPQLSWLPLATPPFTVQELTTLVRMRAVKQLSQNILLALRLTDKIVRKAGSRPNAYVYEVGWEPVRITWSILCQCWWTSGGWKDFVFIPGLQMLSHADPRKLRRVPENMLTFRIRRLFQRIWKLSLSHVPNIIRDKIEIKGQTWETQDSIYFLGIKKSHSVLYS